MSYSNTHGVEEREVCRECASPNELSHGLYGSDGRVVCMCKSCWEESHIYTNGWHKGYDAGYVAGVRYQRRLAWWERLLNR